MNVNRGVRPPSPQLIEEKKRLSFHYQIYIWNRARTRNQQFVCEPQTNTLPLDYVSHISMIEFLINIFTLLIVSQCISRRKHCVNDRGFNEYKNA